MTEIKLHGGKKKAGMVEGDMRLMNRKKACQRISPAILTTVAVDTHYVALLVFQTWPILNFLLNAATEKSL